MSVKEKRKYFERCVRKDLEGCYNVFPGAVPEEFSGMSEENHKRTQSRYSDFGQFIYSKYDVSKIISVKVNPLIMHSCIRRSK